MMLSKYEEILMAKYWLPDTRCIYNPDVYFNLTKVEQDTLESLRKNR